MTNKSQAAFDAYCADPVVKQALDLAANSVTINLLRDAFFRGAKYATDRCKAEHHVPKKANAGAHQC